MFSVIETLAIGDELLTGKIADTNSAYVGAKLFDHALRLSRQTVIPDIEETILSSLDEMSRRAQVVICFGGLGPTSDDRTVDCVSKFLETKPIVHAESEMKMRKWYASRNREVSEQSVRQVRIPATARAIMNGTGMAPGFQFEKGGCQFYCLPGVPSEMKSMFEHPILSEIRKFLGETKQVSHRTWRCLGIAESDLQQTMEPLEGTLSSDFWTGYRTMYPENHFTVYTTDSVTSAKFQSMCLTVGNLLSSYCYTTENLDLEDCVAKALLQNSLSVGLAESCTGGLTAQRLTRVSGASDFLWGALTVYQFASKHQLDVDVASAEEAVSARVSEQLCEGLLKKTPVDIAVGITGFMGPGGGTPEVPEGTTFIHVLKRNGISKSLKVNTAVRSDRYLRQWAASSFALGLIQKICAE